MLLNSILAVFSVFSNASLLLQDESSGFEDEARNFENGLDTLIDANCSRPPNFPDWIQLDLEEYENWSKEILSNGVWVASPINAAEVVEIANWASEHGYKIRASGYHHNWSPLALPKSIDPLDNSCLDIILVNTVAHLNSMEMASNDDPTMGGKVWAEAGASIGDLLQFVEDHGYGMAALPAPGEVSIGGALAISAHGSGVLAKGEIMQPGHSLGSLSNLVLNFTAIVWNPFGLRYQLKTFDRSDPDAKYFLTSLGRTFLTSVTFLLGPKQNMRCETYLDINADELLADPNLSNFGSMRSIQKFLDESGRAEMIWYPFTPKPWLKVWSLTPEQPWKSRAVIAPYNYNFSHIVPPELDLLIRNVTGGIPSYTPLLGQAMYYLSTAGVPAGDSMDLWSAGSKNLLFYIRASTLRFSEFSYVLVTRRESIQQVVHGFYTKYHTLLLEYARKDKYPINGPVEIRFTQLDNPEEVLGVVGAEPPALAPTSPVENCPEFDTAIYISILTFPRTLWTAQFLSEIQQFFYESFATQVSEGACGEEVVAVVRPEWSKGFAVAFDSTDEEGHDGEGGCWRNEEILRSKIPEAFSQWQNTVCTLKSYDEHDIFSNDWLYDFTQCVK